MAVRSVTVGSLLRPAAAADPLAKSRLRRVGIGVGVVGVMIAMVAFVGSIVLAAQVAGGDGEGTVRANDAWTLGVATAALATLKVGIALVLLGIARKLWTRVESVKAGLPALMPKAGDEGAARTPATVRTPFGAAKVSASVPESLPIHRMAYALWLPMVAMGAMVVVVGVVLSIVEASAASSGNTADYLTLKALTQGTEFFGEALVLSGISLLLGSILGSLRQGGAEVQASVGAPVLTPVMPALAKLFVGLMMIGLMVAMVQFGLYVYVATLSNDATIGAYFAWLGPLREASLGLILSGIVLALATIGTKVLPFQFWRIQELIAKGR